MNMSDHEEVDQPALSETVGGASHEIMELRERLSLLQQISELNTHINLPSQPSGTKLFMYLKVPEGSYSMSPSEHCT